MNEEIIIIKYIRKSPTRKWRVQEQLQQDDPKPRKLRQSNDSQQKSCWQHTRNA